MKHVTLNDCTFNIGTIFEDVDCIFTELRVDRTSLPDNVYCYDIRHTDDDWDEPCSLEPLVGVNYFGAIITKRKICFGNNSYIDMCPEDLDVNPDTNTGIEFAEDDTLSTADYYPEPITIN